MVTETPVCIIYSYVNNQGYVYLHIPQRIVKECGITSGARFLTFIRDGRLILEQGKKGAA